MLMEAWLRPWNVSVLEAEKVMLDFSIHPSSNFQPKIETHQITFRVCLKKGWYLFSTRIFDNQQIARPWIGAFTENHKSHGAPLKVNILNPKKWRFGRWFSWPKQVYKIQVPILIFEGCPTFSSTNSTSLLFAGRIFATRPMVCPYTCSVSVTQEMKHFRRHLFSDPKKNMLQSRMRSWQFCSFGDFFHPLFWWLGFRLEKIGVQNASFQKGG